MTRASMPAARPRHRAVMATALALTLSAAANATAQDVELRLQFRPGETHVYEQTTSNRITTPMGVIMQTQTIRLEQEVVRVADDGTADLRVTHRAIRFEQEGPNGRESYDSETDGEPDDPMMAALLGSSFVLTMAPDGSVRSVSGLDELLEDAFVDATARATAREAVESMVGEDGGLHGMQSLPAEAVSPGAEWSRDVSLALPVGTVESENRYRLEEIVSEAGRRIAVIRVQSAAGELQPNPDNPMAAMMDLSWDGSSGEIRFDLDRGLLIGHSANSRVNMEANGQTMEMQMQQSVRLIEG